MNWTTVRTTDADWEAEMLQQILAAHHIPARVVGHGGFSHFGCSAQAVLQVRPQDQWTALLLLSPVDETPVDPLESFE